MVPCKKISFASQFFFLQSDFNDVLKFIETSGGT